MNLYIVISTNLGEVYYNLFNNDFKITPYYDKSQVLYILQLKFSL